jgi:hypothetical protein
MANFPLSAAGRILANFGAFRSNKIRLRAALRNGESLTPLERQ